VWVCWRGEWNSAFFCVCNKRNRSHICSIFMWNKLCFYALKFENSYSDHSCSETTDQFLNIHDGSGDRNDRCDYALSTEYLSEHSAFFYDRKCYSHTCSRTSEKF
jgi:hypothetical protein